MPTELTKNATDKMFRFGVPLENVFSENRVHICITRCLERTYDLMAKNGIRVEDVVSNFRGATQERLLLKEKLILCQDVAHLRLNAGTFLWAVRHFVGLLPFPPLASICCNDSERLRQLASACKRALNCKIWEAKLIDFFGKELTHNFPKRDFLLLEALFTFMRKMSVLSGEKPKVRKSSAYAMIKYFSSAMIVRPFKPGYIDKIDRIYFPVTWFVLLKWPQILNARETNADIESFSFKNKTFLEETITVQRTNSQGEPVFNEINTCHWNERDSNCKEQENRYLKSNNTVIPPEFIFKIDNLDCTEKEQHKNVSTKDTKERITRIGWTYVPKLDDTVFQRSCSAVDLSTECICKSESTRTIVVKEEETSFFPEFEKWERQATFERIKFKISNFLQKSRSSVSFGSDMFNGSTIKYEKMC